MVTTRNADTLDAQAFKELARARAMLLTTFKRDGTPVSSPVWFVIRDGAIWISTNSSSGKAKRLRRDSRVQFAPCTQRGRATGPTYEGRARFMTPDETRAAFRALRRRYLLLDVIFKTINRLMGKSDEIGIAIAPAGTV